MKSTTAAPSTKAQSELNKSKDKPPSSRTDFYRKLGNISNYDLFWLAFGVFVLRFVWFLTTNGLPHPPSRDKQSGG